MRNYKSEYKNYHSKPKQKKNRASRNGASRSNLRVRSKSSNRSRNR